MSCIFEKETIEFCETLTLLENVMMQNSARKNKCSWLINI